MYFFYSFFQLLVYRSKLYQNITFTYFNDMITFNFFDKVIYFLNKILQIYIQIIFINSNQSNLFL